ncbi:MAG: hypothetical protein IPM11_08150 [Micropruina sp.]|nr:hypothetical protein [Micropruina sp.]
MHGPEILRRFLQVPSPVADKYGNHWQYNSRSDRHSKVGCWGIAFDLLQSSTLLRRHVEEAKVVMGVNHTLTDFGTGRPKKLDLVIARPNGVIPKDAKTFAGLADLYGVQLTGAEQHALSALPPLHVSDVGAVLIALEAKAAMTAHVKAKPRLHDELNSSHLCVHGSSKQALAIAYVQVNAATEFVSSVTNNFSLAEQPARVTKHKQPHDALETIQKVMEIPRRSNNTENGFDGLGITVLDFKNDGGPVRLVEGPPAPKPGDVFHYGSMIIRMANEYDTTFANI